MFSKCMNKFLISTLFILFICSSGKGQSEMIKVNRKAIYKMTFYVDSLNADSKREEICELLLGDTVSLFRSATKARKDSIYKGLTTHNAFKMSAPTIIKMGEMSPLNYQVLKYDSKNVKVFDEYLGSDLKQLNVLNYYYEPAGFMDNWKLSSDTLAIGDLLCQKAEINFGGRYWTAWFCPQIPISDGPYKFNNLPGLILKIEDRSKTWCFDFLGLFDREETIVINDKKGLKIEKKEKEKILKERRYYQKNIVAIKEASGTDFGNGKKEAQKNVEKYISTDNNWIELK